MSKIELIKETDIKGVIVYSVEIDGIFVPESCVVDDFKKAILIYERIKKGAKTSKEVIKSEEI